MTKGDIISSKGTGANQKEVLAVGTNGQILSADSAETTGLKWIASSGGLTDFNYAENTTTTSTNNNNYQQRLRLTTGSLEGGDYIVRYCYKYRVTDKNAYYRIRLQDDDTTTIIEAEMGAGITAADSNHREICTAFRKTTLSAGIHNIDFDYSAVGGKTIYLYFAGIELYKVI